MGLRFLSPSAWKGIVSLTGLLIFVYLASFWISRFVKELTFAPFLSVFSLLILACFYPPKFIIFSILPFALLSHALISPYSDFAWIRTLTLILSGGVAAYAAHMRNKATLLSSAYERLLTRLPSPYIVSDITSKISSFNRAASQSLGISASELRDFSWFNLLQDGESKSQDIERYVRLGNNSLDTSTPQVFNLVGLNGVLWRASVFRDDESGLPRLITSLMERPS